MPVKGFSLRSIGQALVELERVAVELHGNVLVTTIHTCLDLIVEVPLVSGLDAENS